MAGDWLKFDKSTPDKPEVWQIADALDIDPDAVVGKLMRLWSWMDDHTQDGNAPSVSKKLLDRVVGVTGFCDAVIDAGWLVDDGQHLSAVNFDRHNGKTAKNRALTAKRVAQHKQKTNADGNDSLTQCALPREEKRREEKNKDIPPKSPKGDKSFTTKMMTDSCAGLSEAVASDYLKFRKSKRAALTESAWLRIVSEIAKTNTTPDDCLSEAMAAGWQGFKADWMANRMGQSGHTSETTRKELKL